MRNKIIVLILFVLVFTSIITTNATAESRNFTAGEFEELIDGILAWKQEKSQSKSVQELIESGLSATAGKSPTEWYIVALRQYKNNYDYTTYQNALDSYVQSSTSEKATDLQRIAIAYTAIGADNFFIQNTIDTATDDLGIMSYLYGLLLLDSHAYKNTIFSRNEIIENILSLTLQDGGWALTGSNADVDVTAMAIQALAPYYEFDDVKSTVDAALTLLSERQLENGDYASWGTRNCESTAQVFAALSAMQIDSRTDERFIKSGNTVIDGLLLYRLSDGSFCHITGGIANEFASVQALYALVAAWRMENNLSSIYRFTEETTEREIPSAESDVSTGSEETNSAEQAESENPSDDASELSSEDTQDSLSMVSSPVHEQTESITETPLQAIFRKWACFIIGVLSLLVLGFLFVSKKMNIRNFLIVFLVVVIALITVFSVEVQSIEEYYQVHIDDINSESNTVFISIRCDTVVGKIETEYLPADGCILEKTEYVLREGDTVFDVLERTVKTNEIQLEYEGAKTNALGTAYIKGINYLYQYDLGNLSGWMYKVNGAFANVSCSDYTLSDGDVIEWIYTCDLGNDVGAE